MTTEHLTLTTGDGLGIEARWDAPNESHRAVVFCHPHPLHGGTMTAPLMEKVTAGLVEAGLAVLRFNFRGVGRSQGTAGDGPEVLQDLDAAMAAARQTGLAVALAGWSFGAATGLRWQAANGDTTPYCGIAPSVTDLPGPAELAPAERTIIMGERDQLIPFAEAEAYARSIGATFRPIAADHFFYYREDRVAALVAEALSA